MESGEHIQSFGCFFPLKYIVRIFARIFARILRKLALAFAESLQKSLIYHLSFLQ